MFLEWWMILILAYVFFVIGRVYGRKEGYFAMRNEMDYMISEGMLRDHRAEYNRHLEETKNDW